ncbi:MAG: hypothetical protein LCH43_13965 [Actinobacteria bacterium]|nr:hypothetical protein [Actinomycetota bacterium]
MAEVLESFDQAAGDHPQSSQVSCMAEYELHGYRWLCMLPILHGGDHVSWAFRWPR